VFLGLILICVYGASGFFFNLPLFLRSIFIGKLEADTTIVAYSLYYMEAVLIMFNFVFFP